MLLRLLFFNCAHAFAFVTSNRANFNAMLLQQSRLNTQHQTNTHNWDLAPTALWGVHLVQAILVNLHLPGEVTWSLTCLARHPKAYQFHKNLFFSSEVDTASATINKYEADN